MRAIIIDDEQKGRNLLNELLKRHCPDVDIVGLAEGALEGIELIRTQHPDLIFLDINMPEINGFGMLEKLGNEIAFELIFVTAYHEFAIKAYKYSAFDYLLKPIDPDELKSTIDRLRTKRKDSKLAERLGLLMKQLEQPKRVFNKITISSNDGITIINIPDIVYLEADGPYTSFYLMNKEKYVASTNLKEYEELLTDHHFFRIHHSYLINLNHVKKFIKSESHVLMVNGGYVDVSKRKREEFLELLKQI